MRYVTFILAMFLLYWSKYNKKYNKFLIISSAIVLLIFSAFREFIAGGIYAGVDYESYRKWFNSIENIKIGITNDFLFNILMLFVYKLTKSFWVFIFITSVFGIYSIYKFAKENSPDYAFTIFLFITFGMYELGLSAIRQFISISIFLLAFKYIKKRNFLKYSIYIIIAALFHSSSLILLLIYPFVNIKIKMKYKLLILVGIGILATIFIKGGIYQYILVKFLPYYEYKYLNIGSELNSNYTVFLISTTILTVIYVFKEIREKLVKNDNTEYMYMLLLLLFSYLATMHPTLGRLLQYFMPAVPLIIPHAIKCITDKKLVVAGTSVTAVMFFLVYVL